MRLLLIGSNTPPVSVNKEARSVACRIVGSSLQVSRLKLQAAGICTERLAALQQCCCSHEEGWTHVTVGSRSTPESAWPSDREKVCTHKANLAFTEHDAIDENIIPAAFRSPGSKEPGVFRD